jgi:uncharacterized protein (TIGR03437 family)
MFVLWGMLAFGELLGSLHHAITLITPLLTLWGSVVIFGAWLAAELLVRRLPIHWMATGGNKIRITSLGPSVRLGVVGIVVLLWLPRVFHPALGSDNERRAEPIVVNIYIISQPPSVQPFADQPGRPDVTATTTFSNSATIAPNTWVAIKGSALAPTGDARIWRASDFVNNKLPIVLDGVSVTMNGENAYVYYISRTELQVLTPPDIAPGSVLVQVATGVQTSAAFTVQAQAYSPAFCVFPEASYVIGAHLNGSLIGPVNLRAGTTPVRPGETVILYAIGFGATSSAISKGSEVQSGNLPVKPTVQIGGISATVLFAGLVAPGEYQLNVVVPRSAANGDNTLIAHYNGQSTQAGVFLTVQSQ